MDYLLASILAVAAVTIAIAYARERPEKIARIVRRVLRKLIRQE